MKVWVPQPLANKLGVPTIGDSFVLVTKVTRTKFRKRILASLSSYQYGVIAENVDVTDLTRDFTLADVVDFMVKHNDPKLEYRTSPEKRADGQRRRDIAKKERNATKT